jgi:hypothetical protein
VETVHRDAYARPAECAHGLAELVRERGLARRGHAVDRPTHRVVDRNVDEETGDLVDDLRSLGSQYRLLDRNHDVGCLHHDDDRRVDPARPSSSAASLVIDDIMVDPLSRRTFTVVVAAPSCISTIVPGSWFLARRRMTPP